MKTKYLFVAVTAMMMVSCSKDEVVSVQKDEIGYDVAVSTLTRAADSYCNNNLPETFNVYAETATSDPSEGATIYIDGDLIQKDGNEWTDVTTTRYWPADKNLNFYAYKNDCGKFDFTLNTIINGRIQAPASFKDFEVAANVEDQVDLMYSVLLNQSKTEKVQLNFRHALSQVCFYAMNKMKGAQVIIKSISVGHLAKIGTFRFPRMTTKTNYTYGNHGDDQPTGIVTALDGGRWEIPENASYNTKYTVKPLTGETGATGSVTLEPNQSTPVNLTGAGNNHNRGFSQVLTLLPQQVNAWNPKTPGANTNDWNGAYFMLNLEINNVAGSGEDEVITPLYSGDVAIPVAIDWSRGYRYKYTFVFEEGNNGGYTPDPSNPQPILTSIKYDVTVDDFVPVQNDAPVESSYSFTFNVYDPDDMENGPKKTITRDCNTPYFEYTLNEEAALLGDDSKEFVGWADALNQNASYIIGDRITLTSDLNIKDLYVVWKQRN